MRRNSCINQGKKCGQIEAKYDLFAVLSSLKIPLVSQSLHIKLYDCALVSECSTNQQLTVIYNKSDAADCYLEDVFISNILICMGSS